MSTAAFQTYEPLPTAGEDGKAVVWLKRSLEDVQRDVRDICDRTAALSSSAPAVAVAVWWIPVDAKEEDAVGVNVDRNFLLHPYTAGSYRVRLRGGARVAYLQCAPVDHSLTREVAAQQAEERRLENQAARIRELEGRLAAVEGDYDKARRLYHDAEDARRAERRRADDLEAELEVAKENEAPLFADEGYMQLLSLLKVWAEGGGEGQAQELLGAFFLRSMHFSESLYRDPEVMARVSTLHAESWESYRQAFNAVSTATQQSPKVLDGAAEIAGFLHASGVQLPRALGEPAREEAVPRGGAGRKATAKRGTRRAAKRGGR